MYHFPSEAGSYALILKLETKTTLTIGRLGCFDFPVGYYIYCGSAHGKGGLAGRLKHHLTPLRSYHWHIDWLRQIARVMDVGYAVSSSPLECRWSRNLASLSGVNCPVPGFGSADCHNGCPAHLFYFLSPEILLQGKTLLSDQQLLTWVQTVSRV